jgi:hypothetical protein
MSCYCAFMMLGPGLTRAAKFGTGCESCHGPAKAQPNAKSFTKTGDVIAITEKIF